MERVKMEILGVKWRNWRNRGTGLTLNPNHGKHANTGVSELLRCARNDGEKSYSSKYWRETWDGLRTFPWREFGNLMGELLPFAA